jgi:hypothetical protein
MGFRAATPLLEQQDRFNAPMQFSRADHTVFA